MVEDLPHAEIELEFVQERNRDQLLRHIANADTGRIAAAGLDSSADRLQLPEPALVHYAACGWNQPRGSAANGAAYILKNGLVPANLRLTVECRRVGGKPTTPVVHLRP